MRLTGSQMCTGSKGSWPARAATSVHRRRRRYAGLPLVLLTAGGLSPCAGPGPASVRRRTPAAALLDDLAGGPAAGLRILAVARSHR